MISSSPIVQNNQTFVSSLEEEQSSKQQHICIVGDGIESLAVANLLGDEPVSVLPLDSPESSFYYGVHSFEIRQRNANVCFYRGSVSGDLLARDYKSAAQKARAIFVCTDATKYSDIAKSVSPYLENGQVICLINSPVGSALEFKNELVKRDNLAQVSVLEVGRIFDSILVESGVMIIRGLRKRIPVSGISRNDTRKGLKIIQSLVDEVVPASNVIERGLTDVERLIRPVLALSLILGWTNGSSLSFGTNKYVLRLLRSIESEIQSLAASFGSSAPEFLKSIHDYMNVGDIVSEDQFDSLELAINCMQRVILGASDPMLDGCLAVLEEDVREVYCLLSDLGRHGHLFLPTIDSVVSLSCSVLERDLWEEGRSVESLGLVGFDNQEITELVNN